MITIDQESVKFIDSPFDISKKGYKCKTSNGLYTFIAPNLDTIENNLFYLLKNSIEKLFNKKYIMKPSYLSYDEYGTTILGDLLMYVNGIYCLEDFNLETVVIPSLQSIIKISNYNLSNIKSSNIKEVVSW